MNTNQFTSDAYLDQVQKSNEWFKSCEVLGKQKKRKRFKYIKIKVSDSTGLRYRKLKVYEK